MASVDALWQRWDAAKPAWHDNANHRAYLTLIEACLRSLPEILTDAVPAGVAYSSKGTWLSTSDTGQTVNALIDADRRTDIMSGACYNDTFVEVALAP